MRNVEPRPVLALALTLPVVVTACAFGATARAEPLFSEYVEGEAYDKALEIWNPSSVEVDLAARGVVVEIYFNGATTPGRRIALAGLVGPGDVFVLAHASAAPALASRADREVGGAFFGGDDAVVLRDSTGVLDVLGQVGVDPGSEWGGAGLGTRDQTLRRTPATVGDADPFDPFDPAASWFGAALGDFDDLGIAPAVVPSTPVPGALRIHDLQGRAHLSPFLGRFVESIPGVVTAVQRGGFHLQDPEPDADPATSEGIFVHAPAAPPVAVGAALLVSGRVAEYRPGGRASSLTITEIVASRVLEAAGLYDGRGVEPEVLGVHGRAVPAEVIDDDTDGSVEVPSETTFDPDGDGIDFYESLEGMWVRVPGAQVVGPTNRFGEIWVVADEGRGASGMNAAGGITLREGDANPERIRASDVLFAGSMPAFDVGARLGAIEGVMSYSFGSYELRLFEQPTSPGPGLLVEGTTLVGDSAHMTIATLNVRNLDPKVEDRAVVRSASDIDDDVGSGRFAQLAAQIVEALASPDVLALQEVQDGDGAERTGRTDAAATYETLVRAIADAGGPTYGYADVAPHDGADGGQPGGNIRSGFLYRLDRLALRRARAGEGGPSDAATVEARADGPELSHDPGLVPSASAEDAPLFVGTRKPLVAQFDPRGPDGVPRRDRTFFVVNAHFASRSGSSPAYGPLQPTRMRREEVRRAQARAIGRFARTLLALDPGARLVVVGDLNAPGFLPPLDELAAAGLVDVVAMRLPPEERYTYVFEGASQDLDHVLVASPLAGPAEVEIIHANAEYARGVTDHDPIVLRLRVGPERARLRGLAAWIEALLSWFGAIFGL